MRWLLAFVLAGLWSWLALAAGGAAAAPARPEEFFGLTNLWTFRLVLTDEAWRRMEPVNRRREDAGPPGLDREYPWATGEFRGLGVVLSNVAVRFKGNSSFNLTRQGRKRPFKLDFDRGEPGRKLAGLEELFFSNNANDPSQMREALAYEVCRRAGLAAPRTALARVYLETPGHGEPECLGLYTVVEAVEGDFLRRSFATKKGLLVKPEGVEGLAYLGASWEDYPGRYQVKNDPARSDRLRLIELTRWANHSSDAEFEAGWDQYLDLTNWVRFLAVNAFLANMDSFLGNGHNYYLFLPHQEGRARFIPWDLNEAFGRHPMAGPAAFQADLAILRPASGRNRLVERFLANPKGAALYRAEVERLRTGPASLEQLLRDVDRVADVIGTTVAEESPMARRQFGFAVLGETNRVDGWESRPGGPPGNRAGPPGPGGSRGPDMPLPDWIRLRHQLVGEQLAGRREGNLPVRRRPGFGPGPGRPGRDPGRPPRPGPEPRPGDGPPPGF